MNMPYAHMTIREHQQDTRPIRCGSHVVTPHGRGVVTSISTSPDPIYKTTTIYLVRIYGAELIEMDEKQMKIYNPKRFNSINVKKPYKIIINIFRMPDRNVLYGDVIEDDHIVGDTFDRFCIYPSGRIEICERAEDKDDIATETETFEVLHTLLENPSVEHTLSRFYGNRDVVFNWSSDITL